MRPVRILLADDHAMVRREREYLIEEDLEVFIRDEFETEGRFAHFADAGSEGRDIFCAKIGMIAESHF